MNAPQPARLDRAQQIPDATFVMFVIDGFANVSLRKLGERVGVQAGSLYNHVESKQTLLFDLVHEHLDALVYTVVRRTSKSSSVMDRLNISHRH
jgi:AcrR family transcriptional regulator